MKLPGSPAMAITTSLSAVNRTWARFFGNGLIDPVDDIESEGDPALVGLIDEVAREFRAHGYDLKYLIRALIFRTVAGWIVRQTDPARSAAEAGRWAEAVELARQLADHPDR